MYNEEIVLADEPIGIDNSLVNEGINSRLDSYGKLRCRVFGENRILDEKIYDEMDKAAVIMAATGFKYADYTFVGASTVSVGGSEINYVLPASAQPSDMMNDFARFLGGLWRQDSGETVKSITFDSVVYHWNEEGTKKGSNWEDADGVTLVSRVTSYFQTAEGNPVVLMLNGEEEIKFCYSQAQA